MSDQATEAGDAFPSSTEMNNPNSTWKEFQANEVSHSMAHYLVTLRDLHASQGYARVTDIADELGVTKSTVSVQIRHLKEREYVTEDKARHLSLTDAGQAVARQVIYNRTALIRFMNKVLGVEADQAEVDACKIEHLLSPATGHKLLGLVHLLLADTPSTRGLLEKFAAIQTTKQAALSTGDASKDVASVPESDASASVSPQAKLKKTSTPKKKARKKKSSK